MIGFQTYGSRGVFFIIGIAGTALMVAGQAYSMRKRAGFSPSWRMKRLLEQFAPDCGGCHAGNFKQDKHKKVSNPKILYTVIELSDCTGACHTYTDTSLTTIEKQRNGKHKVSKGGF